MGVDGVAEASNKNEILAAAEEAKDRRSATDANPPLPAEADDKRWPMATIGLGIGSAALAAALLYARSNRTKK
ncbi:hypothetical protein FBR43_01445 [Sphingomonas baiyangensis]|uniref:Uncharacterized protein n=2 Tax=Sphingomonas baiyangensis TaxID=2572576 RepID=A0A4U1L942_9SPHN|nr:hypothetical protein FBR43_01445 [Sphingomonas baiyangensis]